ncbi:MAG TPA: PIG-L family deacetylase [Pyrinomonadaceae bacterium]|nr:PIG-L family deacetylase [Pyrinomonadaceae bacterium]
MQKPEVRSQNKRSAARCQASVWLALAAFVLSAFAAVEGLGQNAARAGAVEGERAELYQALLDLQSPWTVMCVAAHPDDEDGATLTVLRRKYGVHTVTVFSTYGEGGQNAVGPELYEELGAIRARETMQASEIQGSEPHFLGLKDFGFSKSADEAFKVWGHEEALRRLVLKIRQLRPDVIITNHDTVSGHGHHQATGRLVLEAFDAAADPHRFPEQLKRGGVSVWQPQRLFVRVGAPGGSVEKATPEDEAAIISVNRNERDEVRGTTYAEQALQALQRHATQGPWPQTLPASWASAIRYRLTRSAKKAPPLPPNAQTFLDGLGLPPKIQERLMPPAVKTLLPFYEKERDREQILRTLLQLQKDRVFVAPKGSTDEHRFELMSQRLSDALEVASGVRMTIALDEDVLVPNTPATFSVVISNRSDKEVQLGKSVVLGGPDGSLDEDAFVIKAPSVLAPKSEITLHAKRHTPASEPINVPGAEHLYDDLLFGRQFRAVLKIPYDGTFFFVHATTRVNVAPAVEIAGIAPSPLVLTRAARDLPASKTAPAGMSTESGVEFSLRLINHQGQPFKGQVIAGGPASKLAAGGTTVTLAARGMSEVSVKRSGDVADMAPARDYNPPVPNVVTFSVVGDGGQRVVTQRSVRVVWSDARVAPNLRVGYVRSFDDTIRDSLAALNVEAKELKVEDVRSSDLSRYNAIILDNRGYQAHPELVAANQRLLDYVREGGTLIVFYHRTNEWNPDAERKRPQLAPYPLTLGNSRVTDETAPIQFTEPQHALLNYPNKITPEDFAGWIQERGLYYPEKWDAHYSAPLSTSDKGEAPLRGGLLAADYGRGRYIYTSMVWYRQLRAGVPGAYRVLANMISYGRQQ